MKKERKFPVMRIFRPRPRLISATRRVTPESIEFSTGRFKVSIGRPRKNFGKYQPVTIRLHPYVLEWAKAEGKKRGVGYQTLINQTLLSHTA